MTKKQNSPFKLVVIITLLVFVVLAAIVLIGNKNSETSNDISFKKQPSIEGQPTLGKLNLLLQ